MKRLAPVLATLLVGLSLAGCGGSNASPAAQQSPQLQPTPSISACPKAKGGGFAWPKDMPSDLPQPPHAQLVNVSRANGLTIARFSTPSSLQESVIFVVRSVQQAGYTLGRGDAEPAEADAPFGKDDLRGVYKMLVRESCVTDWLVATTKVRPNGTSPLLPTPSHGPSSHPLPFG